MKVLHSIVILLFTTILLSACGSSGNTDDEKTGALSGNFTFGPVEGLIYECGDLTGLTDSDGGFEYYEGESVTFSVGGLVIGTAEGAIRVSPEDFQGELNITGICQFLMACDVDTNPNNGIQIASSLTGILVDESVDLEPACADFCADMTWYGTEYRIFFNDPDTEGTCETSGGMDVHEVTLETNYVDEDVFTLFGSDYELHTGLVNLFLQAFGDSVDSENIIEYYEDPDDVTHGYFTHLWGLPEKYRDYNRRLAKKILKKALVSPYIGIYSGTYSTSNGSGELHFRLYITSGAVCSVDAVTTGCTWNDTQVEIYGELTDSETGKIDLGLSGTGLLFKGYADPDSGEISGDVKDSNYDVIGSFECQRQ